LRYGKIQLFILLLDLVVSQFKETASGAKAQFHFYGRFGTTQVVPCYKTIQTEPVRVCASYGRCEMANALAEPYIPCREGSFAYRR
jgi:hypothetical protein